MIEGVVRSPSAFSITRTLSPSNTATHELVVPRSIPIILPILGAPIHYPLLTKSKVILIKLFVE